MGPQGGLRRPFEDSAFGGGGTRLHFDVVTGSLESEGGGGGDGERSTSGWGRLRAKYPSFTGALGGAFLATAMHAAPALAAAAEDGSSAVVSLALRPLQSLASFVAGSVSGIGSGPDAVDRFLDDLHLGAFADAFRAVGFMSEEDFFGVTERDLAEEVKLPFAAQRRRVLTHAARRRDVANRESPLWYLLTAGVTVGAIAFVAFAFALCFSPKLRSFTGAYVGVAGAVAWYWGKQFLIYLKERSAAKDKVKSAAGGDGGGGGVGGWMRRSRGGARENSHGGKDAAPAGFGTDDDDSAFEESPSGGTSSDDSAAATAATAAAAAAALVKLWDEEQRFIKPRDEIASWRKSREDYPDYENELLKLKAEVPISEMDADMAIGGDYDNTYRRFLSAQGGKATKALGMLRKTLEWRKAQDLTGNVRQWRTIPKAIKDTLFEHYQSGWYTSHTSLGCPVYIERTGRLHVDKVLKHVTADEMIDHHTRMMEYLMRVLLPEMSRRPGIAAPDKVLNILDMEGLGLHMMTSATMKILKRVLAIDQSFFPEIMYRCYIVNCPTVFRVVWGAVKPLVDKRIQRKIRIMGKVEGKTLDELASVMGGRDRVPAFLGGGCARTLKQCPPWSLDHMDNDDFQAWEAPVRTALASDLGGGAEAPCTP